MNKFANRITTIIITLFLVFVALLLTILIVYIVNDSFKDQETILAGCIGFIGAIIGGAITLIGVNNTIQSNKELAFKNNIPKVLVNIEELDFQLRDAYGTAAFKFAYPTDITQMFESEIIVRGIFKLAANIDKETYQELSILINDFHDCKTEYIEFGSSEISKSYFEFKEIDPIEAADCPEYQAELDKILYSFELSTEEVVSSFLNRLENRKNNYLNQL
ncbi:hypothetical protein [Lysinibacillus xylanilyticus]|uniref:hypothetical protein n=1 Tax=Lysinibacillus xylanilyticus TaxID=582475 RepID=UPI0038201F89